jgi:hypothetical protein
MLQSLEDHYSLLRVDLVEYPSNYSDCLTNQQDRYIPNLYSVLCYQAAL